MQKRYLLIGGLVIAFALVISYFVWGNMNKANGSLAGQSKALVVASNGNGNNDFIPPSPQEVAAHARNITSLMTDSRDQRGSSSSGSQLSAQSKILVVASNGNGNTDSNQSNMQAAQPLIPVTGADFQPSVSPYLIAAGQYVDDHYPASSGSYLVLVGSYHDR
jgi:hypothetical protein